MNFRSFRVRPAAACEAADLSALAVRSKGFWGYDREFMDACRAELSFSRDQLNARILDFQVCEVENNIIAFYVMSYPRSGVAELEALFVDPPFIGRGIGTTIVVHACERAVNDGAVKMVIQSDPNATDFYLSVGAKVVGHRASDSIPGRQLPLFEIELMHIANTQDRA